MRTTVRVGLAALAVGLPMGVATPSLVAADEHVPPGRVSIENLVANEYSSVPLPGQADDVNKVGFDQNGDGRIDLRLESERFTAGHDLSEVGPLAEAMRRRHKLGMATGFISRAQMTRYWRSFDTHRDSWLDTAHGEYQAAWHALWDYVPRCTTVLGTSPPRPSVTAFDVTSAITAPCSTLRRPRRP